MYYRQKKSNSTLDRMLLQLGSEKLKTNFLKITKENRKKAVVLINADNLHFSTLFYLMPEIAASNLTEDLNQRNRTAFLLCRDTAANLELSSAFENKLPEPIKTRSSLKWIFLTGYKDDGLSNEYDQVLDNAASLLTRQYHDLDILPEIVRLLFQRNRSGRYIHDLIWALFSSRSPHVLPIIAGYLRSSNKKDTELANKLLQHASDGVIKPVAYSSCVSWLKENQPYLYFTEESFHQSCDPVLYRVDLEAKYLCKKTSVQGKKAIETLSSNNSGRLESFRHMSVGQKSTLAKYSIHLYKNNRRQWNRWMEYPIEKQIKIAENRLGGSK